MVMMDLLSRLGVDRTFELIEFLILFFVLTSVVTLLTVTVHYYRSRREVRAADKRLEGILRGREDPLPYAMRCPKEFSESFQGVRVE